MIPQGQIGFGTVCSVTVNGMFMKAGIPITSKFGGVLQVNDEPVRFTALISYEALLLILSRYSSKAG